MSKHFDNPFAYDFHSLHTREWIETNGLGGYASSTLSGAHSRRYHGILVAAMNPPVGRSIVLSKLDECIIDNQQRFELSTNQYPGAIHPQGFTLLNNFEKDLLPEFTFKIGSIVIKKTIACVQGENTTLIQHEVLEADASFLLELKPLCASRDYHSLSKANGHLNKAYTFENDLFHTKNYADAPELFIKVPNAKFQEALHWYNNIEYSVEAYRGLEFSEDLFSHGTFSVEMKKGSVIVVSISTTKEGSENATKKYQQEVKRKEKLVKDYTWNVNIQQLILAADQFVVKRGEDLKTVIAGYHWFSDWGRDTMISLPGLCLVTGKFEDAKKILTAFSDHISEGMLPNRFPDEGDQPEYNTIDATLWYFVAVYKYYKYTNDKAFITLLVSKLIEIVDWHREGTRYNIHETEDGLLYGGSEGVQLTWMDAKVGDWVVTPRKGKVVEINALWYNALSILSELLDEVGNNEQAMRYRDAAAKVSANFLEQFWDHNKQQLFDFIDGEYRNSDCRPNQLYAISLPFPLLSNEYAEKVLDRVSEKLLTTRGLRSVSADHPEYKSIYGGNQWHRDGAYHQGTVWSFLLGTYLDSLIAIKGLKGKAEAGRILNTFFAHLNEAGIGTVSEIFDATEPFHPRGCIAQAWGVAEVLRVSLEYNIFISPPNGHQNT